jgi:hypothetical protein
VPGAGSDEKECEQDAGGNAARVQKMSHKFLGVRKKYFAAQSTAEPVGGIFSGVKGCNGFVKDRAFFGQRT